MTATVDTDILVYAVDESSQRQSRARQLLERLAMGPEIVHLLWPPMMGFLRIVTHPSIFAAPLSPDDAMGAIERLQRRPHVRLDGELDGFWSAYRRVAHDVPVSGNLVPDAHLVALMSQHGIQTIWSHDRDLRKFRGITVRDPFDVRYEAGFE